MIQWAEVNRDSEVVEVPVSGLSRTLHQAPGSGKAQGCKKTVRARGWADIWWGVSSSGHGVVPANMNSH